jgi:hypothetical protein
MQIQCFRADQITPIIHNLIIQNLHNTHSHVTGLSATGQARTRIPLVPLV